MQPVTLRYRFVRCPHVEETATRAGATGDDVPESPETCSSGRTARTGTPRWCWHHLYAARTPATMWPTEVLRGVPGRIRSGHRGVCARGRKSSHHVRSACARTAVLGDGRGATVLRHACGGSRGLRRRCDGSGLGRHQRRRRHLQRLLLDRRELHPARRHHGGQRPRRPRHHDQPAGRHHPVVRRRSRRCPARRPRHHHRHDHRRRRTWDQRDPGVARVSADPGTPRVRRLGWVPPSLRRRAGRVGHVHRPVTARWRGQHGQRLRWRPARAGNRRARPRRVRREPLLPWRRVRAQRRRAGRPGLVVPSQLRARGRRDRGRRRLEPDGQHWRQRVRRERPRDARHQRWPARHDRALQWWRDQRSQRRGHRRRTLRPQPGTAGWRPAPVLAHPAEREHLELALQRQRGDDRRRWRDPGRSRDGHRRFDAGEQPGQR